MNFNRYSKIINIAIQVAEFSDTKSSVQYSFRQHLNGLLFLSTIIKWHNYLFKNQTDNGVAVSGLSKEKENWFRINRTNSKKISIVFKIIMFDSGMDP